ncbi:glycoside hydrolase family 15 protein [Citricoccus sp. SGAir0253]|uniref:glycoside hydrolase family 15 protein n=1 Tax=Citricoccus sp. SGAir0253 TaxID=2567881 RepID=UPI0010CCD680|nr:glycoside hydrolase family 15 protein [Citricoccus sp. SGAir0253]QCU78186.1 glycoside hydrolase family 15 protein [Citricoccus sp. SGAir0253]
MQTTPDGGHPPLDSYALLADRRTAALVSREGSLDWLCLPRFDSEAVFAALLGTHGNGHWSLAPVDGEVVWRQYLRDTFVLVTRWRTPGGEAVVTEFMPDTEDRVDVVRQVECVRGEVTVRHELVMRFRYGLSKPWVRRLTSHGEEMLTAVSGPNGLVLHGPLLHPDGDRHVGDFSLTAGQRLSWSLTCMRSWERPLAAVDVPAALAATVGAWRGWAEGIRSTAHTEPIRRSLLVLRALTHRDTGGIVAAATTSLPEAFGGVRNWDYRYVWVRDSAMTIEAMIAHGVADRTWRDWLLRAIAGDYDDLQVLYGIGGERIEGERTLGHLAGYASSRPVRIGNGATVQYQADVVGEAMLALERLREAGVEEDSFSWSLQRTLLRRAAERLGEKDHGIWEMRGRRRYFTHGRAMLWAAFDCGVRAVERHGLEGDATRWRAIRDGLRAEIEHHGVDGRRGVFLQAYDSDEADASLLALPHTGLVAADDPRMLATVRRIEDELVDEHGLVRRYRTDSAVDGLDGPESPFLICGFWLVSQYACTGRTAEADALFHRLVGYGGELGLLAEEYDPVTARLAGNYPQAFSHLGMILADAALREAGVRCTASWPPPAAVPGPAAPDLLPGRGPGGARSA